MVRDRKDLQLLDNFMKGSMPFFMENMGDYSAEKYPESSKAVPISDLDRKVYKTLLQIPILLSVFKKSLNA